MEEFVFFFFMIKISANLFIFEEFSLIQLIGNLDYDCFHQLCIILKFLGAKMDNANEWKQETGTRSCFSEWSLVAEQKKNMETSRRWWCGLSSSSST